MSKRFFTFILSLAVVINFSFSQSGWFWQNPLPQGNYLYSVKFIDNNTMVAVGAAGTVIKSTNLGLNWVSKNTPYQVELHKVFFKDVQTGFIVGAYGNFFRSTNSGETWNLVNIGESNHLWSVFFQNNNGWLGGDSGRIYRSTDGGISWNRVVINTSGSFNDIKFINNSTGWVINGWIFKTTDTGNSWTQQFAGGLGYLNCFFVNENIGFVSGVVPNGYYPIYRILRTTDGGITWSIVLSTGTDPVREIYFYDQLTGWAACSNGYIYKTTNSGVNWSGIYVGSSHNGIFFLNSLTGIVVSNNGYIYKTTNGGSNYFNLRTSFNLYSDSFRDIEFINQSTGFISGNYGYVYETTNAGVSWVEKSTGSYGGPNSIFFYNVNTGWGVDPGIYKTTNSGDNWIQQTFYIDPDYLNFVDVFFVNYNTGFVSGYKTLYPTSNPIPQVYRSTNGGSNWSLNFELPPSGVFGSIFFINEATGWVAGGSGSYLKIIKTTDMGNSWIVQGNSNQGGAGAIFMINYNTGWAASDTKVYKTTDSGNNWNILISNPPYTSQYQSLFFVNDLTGWLGDAHGEVYKTTNGGLTWNFQFSNLNQRLSTIYFINSETGFITGNNSTLLKTTDGGGQFVGLKRSFNSYSSLYELYQNYPNPFNPTTKIRFNIPGTNGRDDQVKLIIYDVLGREVSTLINEQLKPGSYEVDWDGSNYSSGVYFYKLIVRQAGFSTGDFIEMKKMVLLK